MPRFSVTCAPFLVPLALLVSAGCSKSMQPPGEMECDFGTVCRDSDCDTLCDLDEGAPSRDTDGDGTPDYLDEDSDNDGISDLEEAGDEDPKTKPFDRNLDGKLDYLDPNYPLRAGQRDADAGPFRPDTGVTIPADASVLDGSGNYSHDGSVEEQLCPARAVVPPLCLSSETELCDGLDNDCDGTVDRAQCSCQRGQVRKCFVGPPGRRGIGACEDGSQVCLGEEFPTWGPCQGGKAPSAELCDGLDNDCNGCADEIAGCLPKLACPGPGDPRTPDVQPYAPVTLDANDFYQGDDVLAYRWEISGSPCDTLFRALDSSATSQSGKLSYRLEGGNTAVATAHFSLSGSYTVTLILTTADGELRCAWQLRVRAPGLRVELCWDKTGPSAQKTHDAVDLDLHLGKKNATSAWNGNADCYWETCRGAATPWSYGNTTPVTACAREGAQNFPAYSVLGYCPNPRLDADNRLDQSSAQRYVTENISLDKPNPGDRFRVMVHYNTNVPADALGSEADPLPKIGVRPLVNVYCDGQLQGSFGGDPGQIGDAEEVAGFDTPGQIWRVLDVAITGSSCTVTPLTPPGASFGYWLSDWEPAYGP